jgi:DNA polymerase-3 subunit gamma/tau
MEVLGKAQVDMREAPDPRVHLEVVLIRLTHPEADDSPAALLERIERLERTQGTGGRPDPGAAATVDHSSGPGTAATPARRRGPQEPAPGGESPPASAGPAPDPPPAPDSDLTGPELARRTLGAIKKQPTGRKPAGRSEAAPPGPAPERAPAPAPATGLDATSALANGGPGGVATEVSRDQLVQLWGDGLLASLPNRARARFRVGRFVAVEDGTAVFALPNETHRSYCEDVRIEVETALGSHFGTPVPLRLVVDEDPDGDAPALFSNSAGDPAPVTAPAVEHDDGHHDLLDPVVLAAQTELAGAGLSPEERLKQAFPGAEEV